MNLEQKSFISDWADYICKYYSVSDDVACFIACQFALESNFGESQLCDVYNNICGMRVPYARPTTCKRDYEGFAVYDDVISSLLDYFLWLAYNRITQKDLHNIETFKLKLRQSGYCPEKDYISRIQNIYKQL